MIYIKKFENNAAYTAYTASPDFITPNVSYIVETNGVAMTPYTIPETKVVAKFNVTDTSNPTKVVGLSDGQEEITTAFTAIEIDGVAQPTVVSSYTFSTTGEHTVKYTLTDPTELGYCALQLCSGLTSVTIPDGVTSIDQGAFFFCTSLESVTIPNSVTSIGIGAFRDCHGLTSVTIPNSVTSIGDYAFNTCSGLSSVTIGTSVTTIGNDAFAACGNLSSVTIPDSVTTIGKSVFDMNDFEGEVQLTAVTIGSGVTSICCGEFIGSCNNLQSVTLYATTPPEITDKEGWGCECIEISNDAPIYVPAESVDAYKAADCWSDFEDRIQAI